MQATTTMGNAGNLCTSQDPIHSLVTFPMLANIRQEPMKMVSSLSQDSGNTVFCPQADGVFSLFRFVLLFLLEHSITKM